MVLLRTLRSEVPLQTIAEVGKTYAKMNWETADTLDWLCVYLNNNGNWTDIPNDSSIANTNSNSTSGNFIYYGEHTGDHSYPSQSTLKPGTTYNLKLCVRRKDSQLWSYGNNVEFTTSPVAMISNLSDGFSYNIGDNLIINFSNSSINKSWLSLEIENTSGVFEEILKTDEAIQSDSYTWLLSNYAWVIHSQEPFFNCLVLPSLLSFLSIFIPPISPYHFLKI